MIRFKFNVLETLKENGYSTYRIRKEKLFSETTLQSFREGKVSSIEMLNRLCEVLDMQPGNIIKYVPDED